MVKIDAAAQVARWLELRTMDIITPNELADQLIRDMLGDSECDPAAILRGLPPEAQAAVVRLAREYGQKDYVVRFLNIGPGESPQDAIDRQPKLRDICHALLSA